MNEFIALMVLLDVHPEGSGLHKTQNTQIPPGKDLLGRAPVPLDGVKTKILGS